ncbi:MAG: cytochrome c biogenesis protein CcsA [Acidimicrobiaceae bacterium]|jgi:heme exporter protein C|nr:cytochrome c biogenesis protein CcsA [Acidimicrobiaceae bacterium]MDG1088641.1 cytochrome c biogenesis protein CcsA [Acidimicrobiales bacterium]HAY68085.1 cytochrome C biogenesis protein [Acidimicrobiaceae bacterium]
MTITSAAPQTNSVANNPGSTGSTATRALGLASLVGLAVLLVLAFVITDPDQRVFDRGADLEPLLTGQGDAVRLLYVHFPVAMVTYIAFSLNAVGSIAVLWKKSTWWDNTAAAAAEVGVLFCGLTLVTGSIWGRPIWNTWWKWGDVRLMTTTILFLIFVGYLAYRRTMTDSRVRAKRSAVVGLIGAINIPIVYKSVDWWQNRTLHQQSTLRDRSIEDLTLFAMIFGMVVFVAIFAWLMIHRFRIGWLEHQTETVGLEAAIEERRAQTSAAIFDAVTDSRPSHETGSD